MKTTEKRSRSFLFATNLWSRLSSGEFKAAGGANIWGWYKPYYWEFRLRSLVWL